MPAAIPGPAPYIGKPLGYVKMTSISAAAPLSSIPKNASYAVLQAETQAVRMTDDGATTPTSSVGITLAVGSLVTYTGNLSMVQVIQSTTGAILHILYYQ